MSPKPSPTQASKPNKVEIPKGRHNPKELSIKKIGKTRYENARSGDQVNFQSNSLVRAKKANDLLEGSHHSQIWSEHFTTLVRSMPKVFGIYAILSYY